MRVLAEATPTSRSVSTTSACCDLEPWVERVHCRRADVPSVLTEQPGQYTLVVSVVSGRDSASSNTTTSVLLSRTIEVTQAANVETIITGAVAGALLLN